MSALRLATSVVPISVVLRIANGEGFARVVYKKARGNVKTSDGLVISEWAYLFLRTPLLNMFLTEKKNRKREVYARISARSLK